MSQPAMSGPPSQMVQTAMANGIRPIKDEASPLSKTSPASSWHSPQQGQGMSPNSTAPSLGPGSQAGGGPQDPRFGAGPQMPQSGAAYSMTPGNPVSVYQQGAQAAVMPGQPGMAMMGREMREMPGGMAREMGREMQQAVAVQQQQQQAEAQRQRQESMRQEGREGHRRMMSGFGEGEQEAKRQRLYAPGPAQGGPPPGYS